MHVVFKKNEVLVIPWIARYYDYMAINDVL
jgi:hypothetical protein